MKKIILLIILMINFCNAIYLDNNNTAKEREERAKKEKILREERAKKEKILIEERKAFEDRWDLKNPRASSWAKQIEVPDGCNGDIDRLSKIDNIMILSTNNIGISPEEWLTDEIIRKINNICRIEIYEIRKSDKNLVGYLDRKIEEKRRNESVPLFITKAIILVFVMVFSGYFGFRCVEAITRWNARIIRDEFRK